MNAKPEVGEARVHCDHHKWTQTDPSTRVHASVYTYVGADSPVGQMLQVAGVTMVTLTFEDGTTEWWEKKVPETPLRFY